MPRKPRREKLRFIDPVLVSLPEFTRMSGLGRSVVRQLVEEGDLPVRTILKRRWIIRDAAIEWLRRQVEPSRPARAVRN
jgi:predicted DNA-binding transcriptional regulator AlpA